MFLFLLIAFMVGWALGLAVWTQRAFGTNDDKGQAENWRLRAIGTRSLWIDLQSHALDLARVAEGCSAMPDGSCASRGWSDRRRRWGLQEGNAGVSRLNDWTSWSRELKKALAAAMRIQFDAHHSAEWPAQRRCEQNSDVGQCWLSLAQSH